MNVWGERIRTSTGEFLQKQQTVKINKIEIVVLGHNNGMVRITVEW